MEIEPGILIACYYGIGFIIGLVGLTLGREESDPPLTQDVPEPWRRMADFVFYAYTVGFMGLIWPLWLIGIGIRWLVLRRKAGT